MTTVPPESIALPGKLPSLGRYSTPPEVQAAAAPRERLSFTAWAELAVFAMFYVVAVDFSGKMVLFHLGNERVEIAIRLFYPVMVLSVGMCLFRGRWIAIIATLLVSAYFLYLALHFTHVSADAFGATPLKTRYGFLILPVAYLVCERGNYKQMESIIYWVGAAYAAWYFVAFVGILVHIFHPSKDNMAVISYSLDSRGDRVTLDGPTMALTYFLSFVRLRKLNFVNIGIFLLCLIDIFLSKSRVYEALIVLITVTALITRSSRQTGLLAGGLYLVVSGILIGFLVSPVSIFGSLGSDLSAAARSNELAIAKSLIAAHWVNGVGLATTDLGDKSVTLVHQFYWNDLGPIGVLYVGGLIGLFVFLTMAGCCFIASRILAWRGAPPTFADGFGLAAALIALDGITSPILWSTGLGMFALLFAALLAAPRGPAPPPIRLRPGTKVRAPIQRQWGQV